MKISMFNGGLNTRAAKHLLNAAQSTVCNNVDFDKFEIAYYNSLADKDPVKVRYLKGWAARALKY